MKLNNFSILAMAVGMAGCMSLSSCLSDGDETIVLSQDQTKGYFGNTDVPVDGAAGEAPDIDENEINASIPNISYMPVDMDGTVVVNLDLTGIYDSQTGDWLRLYGTGEPNQNVWVDLDGTPKGVRVYNNADDKSHQRSIDLVFLVDNSGSMDDEADAIARDIINWADELEDSGLDIRFACVGYDGRITGGIDFTTAQELSSFFNYSYGTRRTYHWGGTNASRLENLTSGYNLTSMRENGVAALRFADENYSFRKTANRIYVNFTDEYNEVQGSRFTVESLKTDWDTNQGTVHTVYSASQSSHNNPGVSEQPWLMSEYTGGTTIFTSSSFSGVTLSSLPVTGAMRNSYILRFSNIEKYIDDGLVHNVRITIDTESVHAFRDYQMTFVRP